MRPDLWALVSFLYFMLSSKPEAFSQNRPSQVGKYVPLNNVCSRIPSTPPNAWSGGKRGRRGKENGDGEEINE